LYGAGGGDAAAIVIDMRSLGYIYKFSTANFKKSEFYGLFASVLIRTYPYLSVLKPPPDRSAPSV